MIAVNEALLISGLVTIFYQLFFFAIAATFKFDKVTDLAGGTNFAVVAIIIFVAFACPNPNSRQIALTIFDIVWAVRLSGFLFYRVIKFETDSRFDGTREDFCKFLYFWIFQMFWVFVVSLPIIYVNTTDNNSDLNAADYVGFCLAGLGLICEAWSDQSKLLFKVDASNKGKWCDWGLWKYSRHPNYFGELSFWWGIFISAIQSSNQSQGDGYYIILSPLFITGLLFGLSGMPILEKTANERFGKVPAYQQYRQETSVLIPLPNMVYRNIPLLLKQIFLLEWPIYERVLAGDSENSTLKNNNHPSNQA